METIKTLVLLGATGSIGQNAIEVIKAYPQSYKAKVLVANVNATILAKNAKEVGAEYAAIMDESKYKELKCQLSGTRIKIVAGESAILELCKEAHDITLSAIVGAAGLKPTYACLAATKRLAIANKETLVVAGELINAECQKRAIEILPVDSEHSAIFQALERHNAVKLKKITLTASGGPFKNYTFEQLKSVTPKKAIKHPNWKMGAKISVDSATLINKGLEFIEAYFLFPVSPEQIEVLIHPESVIHSMVTYQDGSSIAQLSMPDMKCPISYALSYPSRNILIHKELNLAKLGSLTFHEPNYELFPLLKLSQEVVSSQAARIILNVANEIAVEAFLKEQISFLQINDFVHHALQEINHHDLKSLNDILDFMWEVSNHCRLILAKFSMKS